MSIPGVQHSMVTSHQKENISLSTASWEQEYKTEEKVGQVWKELYVKFTAGEMQ